jgi:hypothetical protein
MPLAGGTLLVYRSDESLGYTSSVYRATETVDFRYPGALTAHTRNTALRDLRGAFEDFGAYTYDAGRLVMGADGPEVVRTDEDRYSRDTLGVYLEPDTVDADAVSRGVRRLRTILPEFMPATDRAVFLTRSDVHADHVYTYSRPGAPDPRFIGERWSDTLTDPLGSELPPGEDFTDDLE